MIKVYNKLIYYSNKQVPKDMTVGYIEFCVVFYRRLELAIHL